MCLVLCFVLLKTDKHTQKKLYTNTNTNTNTKRKVNDGKMRVSKEEIENTLKKLRVRGLKYAERWENPETYYFKEISHLHENKCNDKERHEWEKMDNLYLQYAPLKTCITMMEDPGGYRSAGQPYALQLNTKEPMPDILQKEYGFSQSCSHLIFDDWYDRGNQDFVIFEDSDYCGKNTNFMGFFLRVVFVCILIIFLVICNLY